MPLYPRARVEVMDRHVSAAVADDLFRYGVGTFKPNWSEAQKIFRRPLSRQAKARNILPSFTGIAELGGGRCLFENFAHGTYRVAQPGRAPVIVGPHG